MLREETEGNLQMLVSLRQNGPDSLFKEARVLKERPEALIFVSFSLSLARFSPDLENENSEHGCNKSEKN